MDEIKYPSIITLGTGCYGECILVGFNKSNWIIIDSCINPLKKGQSLALDFLNSNNIQLINVKCIVCTHLHDDHIKGISTLVEQCTDALFVIAECTDIAIFFHLLGFDKLLEDSGNSVTSELRKCFDIINKRDNHNIKRVKFDQVIYQINNNNKLFAISPSDAEINLLHKNILKLISETQSLDPNKRMTFAERPNHRSIALYGICNNVRFILGADLENGTDNTFGWDSIVNSSQIIYPKDDLKSSFFKIPHHGSDTGYNKEFIDNKIDKEAKFVMTPFKKGKSNLPTDEMIEKYLTHTKNIAITAMHFERNKAKIRPKNIQNLLDKVLKDKAIIIENEFKYGVVIAQLDEDSSEWIISTEESAQILE